MSKLNEQAIYNKEFNVEFKGYSTLEVDTFLDQIILDYQYFNFELQKAKEIIQQLQQQNALLQSKLIEAQGKANALSSTDNNMNQVDLLKRLAKLEQEVYNKWVHQAIAGRKIRGKSMLAPSVMMVVIMLNEKINSGR